MQDDLPRHPLNVTEQDVSAAYRAHSWMSIQWKSLVLWMFPGPLLFGVIACNLTHVWVVPLAGAAVWMACILGAPVLDALVGKPALARRLYRQNTGLFMGGTYAVDEHGLQIVLPLCGSDTRFACYIKWCETTDHYLLYLNSAHFQVLPKRDLAPGDDLILRAGLVAAGVPKG